MAARVMRIMCATITSVSVNAGRAVRYTRSQKSASGLMLASDGNIFVNDDNPSINR